MFSQDVQRFTRLLASPVPERRVEGIQGLSGLKYWPAEEALIERLSDTSPNVRREAVVALGRLGSARTVPHLITLLGHSSWEMRETAGLSLRQMTAQPFGPRQQTQWEQWWRAQSGSGCESTLLAAATNSTATPARKNALRALRHLATPASEATLAALLHAPGLDFEERVFAAETLERIGTAKSIPVLAGFHTDAAAWALGRIGGATAEQALLNFPKTLVVLLNLDRLRSTNCGSLVPYLVGQMGLVTYRGQPDDLMNREAQPIQRVGASLIRRAGLAPMFIEVVLQELEDTMKPAVTHAPRPPIPQGWKPMLESMREELKPGFVRDDGVTRSQPLTALWQLADDLQLAKRLTPLLRHPAFVPRVYVAMTLARVQAAEALPAMTAIIREGYPFSDAVALASGKHFDQSQAVRWRGFLCMALGRLGGEEARQTLETLAVDTAQPRDIRYSSVVGLGFIASPKSLPALRQAATNDIVWMVRDEARRAAEDIELLSREVKP